MNRATGFLLAFTLAFGSGFSFAYAQGVVVGSSDSPNVVVNWSVLERLGPSPTLADRLKDDVPTTPLRQQLSPSGKPHAAVAFQPYKPERPQQAPAVKRAAEKKPALAQKAPEAEAPAEPEAIEPKAVPVAKAEPPPSAPSLPKIVAEPVPESPAATAAAAPVPAPEPVAAVEPPAAPAPASKPAPAKAVATAKPETVKPEFAKPEPAAIPAAPIVVAEPAPVVAAPVPAPVPAPAPAAIASLTPPAVAPVPAPVAVLSQGDTMSVRFTREATRLPDAAQGELKGLASRMERDEALNLQLLAYADGDDASASKARRLSLSRALEVRKFLMEQGVRSTRIEVRALGHKTDGGPADRVDAILISR